MRKLLYLLNKAGGYFADSPLLPEQNEDDITVVLFQDAVGLQHVPARRVYALADDAAARHISPVFPTISYGDMLRLMFEADTVVAL